VFARLRSSGVVFQDLIFDRRSIAWRGQRVVRVVRQRREVRVHIEKCEERMTRRVHSVRPLDSIQHARELMVTHRFNQLPVLAEGHLVGIVTDRDLRDAFPSVFESTAPFAPQRAAVTTDPKDIRVEEVMTANVLTLTSQDSLIDAARLMRRERIGAVPIVEGQRVVGILTRSDVLEAFVALADKA
jgi:acetoin utilization protein AcuB